MHLNWSIVINVLLLVSVIFALIRMMKKKNDYADSEKQEPNLGALDNLDDVIAVRKITSDVEIEPEKETAEALSAESKKSTSAGNSKPVKSAAAQPDADSILIFLMAKKDKQLSGYELLQNILASGLRFGDGHIFHRHQHANGKGIVLFSLAAATPTGIFDLQNIGAFHVRGLCFFMKPGDDKAVDLERFDMMLETAQQLSDSLDTYLLDAKQQPLSEKSKMAYRARLAQEDMVVD